MEKKEIRKKILEYRKSMDAGEKSSWDESIFSRLINSKLYKMANTIFTFVSFKTEVDTHRIIKYAISDGKTICVPKIQSKEREIELFRIDNFKQLKRGYFGMLEPVKGCLPINENKVDLILMPGVAFDRKGGRWDMEQHFMIGYY